jgi:hypothetical protein
MRLIYTNDPGREVKVGDDVELAHSGQQARVHYFRPPHKPESEGHVTVLVNGTTREYYVSVIGAEWIEREDRLQETTLNPDAAWPYPTRTPAQLPAGNPEPDALAGFDDDWAPNPNNDQGQAEPGLPTYGSDEDNAKLKPGLYLGLFHGRDSKDEVLHDWGYNGPAIGPLKFAHTTYASEIKLEFVDHEDWKRYFPDENAVSGFQIGPAFTGSRFIGLGEEEIGSFDNAKGGWPKLNDPAVRQDLLDRQLVSHFDFKVDADLQVVGDGLVEFRGKYYGDWTVFVSGVVLPTAAQVAEELRARPDLHPQVNQLYAMAEHLAREVVR